MDTIVVRALPSSDAAAKYAHVVLRNGGSVVAITYAATEYGSWHVFARVESEDALLKISEDYRVTSAL